MKGPPRCLAHRTGRRLPGSPAQAARGRGGGGSGRGVLGGGRWARQHRVGAPAPSAVPSENSAEGRHGLPAPRGLFLRLVQGSCDFLFFLTPPGVLRLNVLSLQFDKFWASTRHLCLRNCLPVLNPLFGGAQINPKKQLRV